MGMIAGMIQMFGKTIAIQTATTIAGTYTGDTVTWATTYTVQGVVRPISGEDANTLEKMGLEAEYKVYLEASDITITEANRFLIDGKYYLVSWIQDPMSAKDFLQVFVKGSDNNGSSGN